MIAKERTGHVKDGLSVAQSHPDEYRLAHVNRAKDLEVISHQPRLSKATTLVPYDRLPRAHSAAGSSMIPGSISPSDSHNLAMDLLLRDGHVSVNRIRKPIERPKFKGTYLVPGVAWGKQSKAE